MLAGETIYMEHRVKQLASTVLFEDAFKEAVNYNSVDYSRYIHLIARDECFVG